MQRADHSQCLSCSGHYSSLAGPANEVALVFYTLGCSKSGQRGGPSVGLWEAAGSGKELAHTSRTPVLTPSKRHFGVAKRARQAPSDSSARATSWQRQGGGQARKPDRA